MLIQNYEGNDSDSVEVSMNRLVEYKVVELTGLFRLHSAHDYINCKQNPVSNSLLCGSFIDAPIAHPS